MLQVAHIRENKEAYIKAFTKRNFEAREILEQVITLDENRRNTQTQLDNVLADSNKISKEIGLLFKSGEIEKANELKVIIFNKHDLKFAEEQAAKVNKDCILYLQPEWSVRDKVVPLIVDFVMANPQWKVSLQTHKYLNIP